MVQRIRLNDPPRPQSRIRGQFAPRKPVPASPQTRGNNDLLTVASKYPGPLLLRIFREVDAVEPTMTGVPREYKRWVPITGPDDKTLTITINGCAYPQAMPPDDYHVIGGRLTGYALTHNVPAEFFNTWFEQNRDSDLVRNKIIFAHPTEASARAQVKECMEIKSGLEAIDPDNPSSKSRELGTARVKVERGTVA
jgi:hypothetical protein